MSVTIHLPDGVEEQLRSKFSDLDRHILEGFVIEKYRRGELSKWLRILASTTVGKRSIS